MIDCAGKILDLSQPQVMGVLNTTPDSFSDGGSYVAIDNAVARAVQMVVEGASIIDVGGESTRPAAAPVSIDEELQRVIPVIEALQAEIDVPVSIDTRKPEVMRAAVSAGAGMINDITALQAADAVELVVRLNVPVCLMHMQGSPASMQDQPAYDNVVTDVISFLEARAQVCLQHGMARENILLDPGFGFGKTVDHNLQLLQQLDQLVALGFPVLVGLSRKSMIGHILDLPVDKRLYPGISLAVLAVWQGAALVRSHDVKATVEAIRMCHAVRDVAWK